VTTGFAYAWLLGPSERPFTTMTAVPPSGRDWVGLTPLPLPIETATAWATTPPCGAVVCFTGVVRDHSEGRDGVEGLTYEAYEEEATRRLAEVIDDARRRWPAIDRVALLHRVGDLALSEASVVVVVSAPHRAEAFDAARYCIDTLKETVPIWKREHWVEGSDWATSGRPVRPVGPTGAEARGPVGPRA